MSELQGLQSNNSEFLQAETQVIAISVDPTERSRQVADQFSIRYLLLSDPDLKVIDRYGLRHAGGSGSFDISRPATFVIDRYGVVRWRDLTENYRVRVRPQRLLQVVTRLP